MPEATLSVVWFAATRYAIVFAVFAAAYGLGRRVLRRLHFSNACEETAFSASLGLGIIAQCVFLLGLVRLIYAWSMLLLLVIAAAVGVRELKDAAVRIAGGVRRSEWVARAVAAAVILLILFLALLPLYPPYTWDALSYHLPSSRMYAVTHAVHPTPYLRFCVFTQLNEMLFTLAFSISDAVAAQGLEFLLFLLTGCAAAGAAGRVNKRAMLPAAIAWFGMPHVILLGSQGYIDVGLALYATVFIAAAWIWLGSGDDRWLLLAAANAGFASGTKYTALFLIGCFGLLLIVRAIRERKLLPVVRFTVVVALIAAPWYGYIYYHTGNPLFPFVSRVFGPGCWSASDVAHVEKELRDLGSEHSFRSLVLLPWNLAFERGDFHREAPLSKMYLGLPVWIAAGVISKKTRFAALFFAAYLLFWFMTAQVPRYLLPVLPTMCVLAGSVVAWMTARLDDVAGGIVIAAISLIFAAEGTRFTWARVTLFGKPPVNREQTSFFFRNNPTYGCYEWLNRQFGRNYVVYAFDPPYMSYYADGTRIGDVVGPGRYRDFAGLSGNRLKAALERLGVQFVLFSSDPNAVTYPLPRDAYFGSHFRPVATCNAGTVFRISAMPFRRVLGEEIVANAGFEDGAQHWAFAPELRVDTSGTASHTGNVAVRVDPSSIPLVQPVTVRANRAYEITYYSRREGSAARSRFVISWFDSAHRDVHDDVHVVAASTTWTRETFVVTAPPAAKSASLYPESLEQPLWYDDISMREVSYENTGEAEEPAERSTVFGVYRPEQRRLFARHDVSEGFADEVVAAPADGLPVAGDWDGDRRLDTGLYAPASGVFHLLGRKPQKITMAAHMLALAGDWTGRGTSSVGTFDPRRARFELHVAGSPPLAFVFGLPGDLPVSGDWDGDGVTTIGVYRRSTRTFYLRNSNSSGPADVAVRFGSGEEGPVAGDWNLDGRASPGLFDGKHAAFRLLNEDGTEVVLRYGLAGDRPFSASLR